MSKLSPSAPLQALSAVQAPQSRQSHWLSWIAVGSVLAVVAAASILLGGRRMGPQDSASSNPFATDLPLEQIPFNGARAFEYLKMQCALGPRPMGSAAMLRQQEMLVKHFQTQGGVVALQKFQARSPLNGQAVPGANILVEWFPERQERILLCAHYDTRPFPDQDRVNRTGIFLGANDGGSGVAVLMELGSLLKTLPGELGVDFVLFDGEELVYKDGDPYFLGSTYFAREYVAAPPKHTYRCAVLLDMIGDADLKIVPDRATMSWPESKPLVDEIWSTAEALGVKEFVRERGPRIMDDHLPLRNIAHIPACDLIDFEYPHWHTQQDTPDKCSPKSLALVGWVVSEWLKQPGSPGKSVFPMGATGPRANAPPAKKPSGK